MGHEHFEYTSYATRARMRAETGDTIFTHHAAVRQGRAPALHPLLDLRRKPRRESRDSVGKPPSTPVLVLFDVTGSMADVPAYLVAELHKLMRLIIEGGVVSDPQICLGAVGDATCDQAPFAMGEFEAGDEKLEATAARFYLEGGGGGGQCESYELGLWFAANQVDTDAWEKRGEKGFLFIIGDEMPYDRVNRDLVQRYLGAKIQTDVPIDVVAQQVQERWHTFILRPGGTSNYGSEMVHSVWTRFFPMQHVMRVERRRDILPTIAGTICLVAGQDLETTLAGLAAGGFDGAGAGEALIPLSRAGATDAPIRRPRCASKRILGGSDRNQR